MQYVAVGILAGLSTLSAMFGGVFCWVKGMEYGMRSVARGPLGVAAPASIPLRTITEYGTFQEQRRCQ